MRFYSFVRDCQGATAIEYTLIAAGIAVAISFVVFAFGEQIRILIEDLSDILSSGAG